MRTSSLAGRVGGNQLPGRQRGQSARASFEKLLKAGTPFRDETDVLRVAVPKTALNNWIRQSFGDGIESLKATIAGMSLAEARTAAFILQDRAPLLTKGSREHVFDLLVDLSVAHPGCLAG